MPEMFDTIVVPVAFDEKEAPAVPHAAVLARQAGAALELLTVRPSYVDADQARGHLADIAHKHGFAEHRDGERHAREHGVPARLEVTETGDVAAVLTEVAARPGTLLCLQTHARHSVGELALGSVSEQVVRRCEQPVLLVGPNCGPPPRRYGSLVVGLDGSDLAERILPVATEWALRLELVTWLFEVVSARMPLEVGEDVQETAYVHRVAESLARRGVEAEWETVRDRHPGAAIARFADERLSALVALTTHGHSGLGRLALGSVALDVTHRATVPVLAFRPPTTDRNRSGEHE